LAYEDSDRTGTDAQILERTSEAALAWAIEIEDDDLVFAGQLRFGDEIDAAVIFFIQALEIVRAFCEGLYFFQLVLLLGVKVHTAPRNNNISCWSVLDENISGHL
jgi:hypothetical protein